MKTLIYTGGSGCIVAPDAADLSQTNSSSYQSRQWEFCPSKGRRPLPIRHIDCDVNDVGHPAASLTGPWKLLYK